MKRNAVLILVMYIFLTTLYCGSNRMQKPVHTGIVFTGVRIP